MLGVVRIYSRKVGYLFDDCKEARERISLVSFVSHHVYSDQSDEKHAR